jgi:hypothetical protein
VHRLRRQLDVCTHEDPERKGLMQNWVGILRCALEDDQEWMLSLNDDVELLPGWQEHLELAWANSPQPFLGLTHFGGWGETAVSKGAAFCEGPYLVWGGALSVRRDQLLGLLDFAEFHQKRGYKHDDCIVAAYALMTGQQTAMTSHAIVGLPKVKSLLGHHPPINTPNTTILDSTATLEMYTNGVPAQRVVRQVNPKDEFRRLVAEFKGEELEYYDAQHGDRARQFPVQVGDVWQIGDHIFCCSDLMDSFTFETLLEHYPPAVVYTDPPWGQGLANTFRTKAGLAHATYSWKDIYHRVAQLGHRYDAPVWVEGSEISREFGAPVPSLISRPDGPTQRRYWTISYMGGKAAGLFYAGAVPPPELTDLLPGFKGVRQVLSYYSGRVMDACSGLGGIALEAAKLGLPSINNELNPWRMSVALSQMSELLRKDPVKL